MLLRSLINTKCSLEAVEISRASSEHFELIRLLKSIDFILFKECITLVILCLYTFLYLFMLFILFLEFLKVFRLSLAWPCSLEALEISRASSEHFELIRLLKSIVFMFFKECITLFILFLYFTIVFVQGFQSKSALNQPKPN